MVRVLVCSVWDILRFWSNGVGTNSESDTYTHTHPYWRHVKFDTAQQDSACKYTHVITRLCKPNSAVWFTAQFAQEIYRSFLEASAMPVPDPQTGNTMEHTNLKTVWAVFWAPFWSVCLHHFNNEQFQTYLSTSAALSALSAIPRRKCSIRAALIDHRLELSKC